LRTLKESNKSYYIPKLGAKWQDVAAHLTLGDVAIEFFRTYMNDYGAVVIKKEWKYPKIIRLGNLLSFHNKIYTLDEALRCAINNTEYDISSRYNAKDEDESLSLEKELEWTLCKNIWTKELLQYFPQDKTGKVYFAADGNLQLYGIENLPYVFYRDKSNWPTMSDVYRMYRLSSTRVLTLDKDNESNIIEQAVLYGGLNYQLDDSLMIVESHYFNHEGESPRIKNLSTYLHTMLSGNNQRGINRYIKRSGDKILIDPLDGTLKELSNISTIINASSYKLRHCYTDKHGNEESFKVMSGNAPSLLHIATHGLYFHRVDSTSITQTEDVDDMQRSALLFAGAENTFAEKKLPTFVEDGILCAQEIAQLDLRNVRLAVLSACETAKGELSRDGVVGLQRGFKKAGVRSLIMSLWKVDDEATCYLMTEFYRHWLGDKSQHIDPMSKHDALECAKNAVRKKTEWESPEYWSAFILLDGLD
jgi:CHAT domain-containing protein